LRRAPPAARRDFSGNGSERFDENGMATVPPSRPVSLLEPILEEHALEARLPSKVKDEADFEVGCREGGEELAWGIRVKRFPRLVLDDHLVIYDHVHSLGGERFTAEIHQYRYFSGDSMPLLDEESFQCSGVEVLAKSEPEFLVDFEERIDDRRRNIAMEQRLLASHAQILADGRDGPVIVSMRFRPFRCLPVSVLRPIPLPKKVFFSVVRGLPVSAFGDVKELCAGRGATMTTW
jgi:hypothetical protein